MNPQAQKVKVFFSTAVVLGTLGTILYTLAHLLATDGSGYFIQGHPLPMIANILSIVSVLWFSSALVLIPKDALPDDDHIAAKPALSAAALPPIIGSLAAALICFTMRTATGTVGLCAKVGLVACIASAAYFMIRLLGGHNLRSLLIVLGIGTVLQFVALSGMTYFDQSTYMNSPIKTSFQLAWIATMLFMTAEIRCTIGTAQPRRYLACACIALYANAAASIPHLVYLFKDSAPSYQNMAYAVLCFAFCIYLVCRLCQFSKFCNTQPVSEIADAQLSPDQIQGKDTCDGCQ